MRDLPKPWSREKKIQVNLSVFKNDWENFGIYALKNKTSRQQIIRSFIHDEASLNAVKVLEQVRTVLKRGNDNLQTLETIRELVMT